MPEAEWGKRSHLRSRAGRGLDRGFEQNAPSAVKKSGRRDRDAIRRASRLRIDWLRSGA
jgi:hypothetical protein